MNNKWLKILLLFSLSLNLAVLGVLGYSVATQYRKSNTAEEVPLQNIRPGNIAPEIIQSRETFQESLRQKRRQVREKRDNLAQLLMEQPPDRKRIQGQLKELNTLQANLQQSIIDQILWETSHMTPDQRKQYLSSIRGRMCGKMMGMRGFGMGSYRCGRGMRHGRRCP